jgi:hypothetical protein
MAIESHVHQGAVAIIPTVAVVFAVFATLHLLALTINNRLSRAYLASGF